MKKDFFKESNDFMGQVVNMSEVEVGNYVGGSRVVLHREVHSLSEEGKWTLAPSSYCSKCLQARCDSNLGFSREIW